MGSKFEAPFTHLFREQDRVSQLMRDALDSPTMRLMREQDKISQLMRDALDSPAMRLMREQDKVSQLMRDALDSPTMRLMREQDKISQLMRDALDSPAMRLMREQDKVSQLMRDALDSPTMRLMREQDKVSRLMRDALNSPTMRLMRESATTSKLIRDMTHLFPTEMQSLNSGIEAVVEAAAGENLQVRLAEEVLVGIFDHLLTMLRQARSMLELRKVWKLAELLIPLVFAWYLALASDQHTTEVGEEIRRELKDQKQQTDAALARERADRNQHQNNVERKLDELLALAREKENALKQRTFYLVKRPVVLCALKKICGDKVAYLDPGDDVELLERAGKWIYVEVIVEDGQTVRGWVLKKYLRRER